MTAGAAPEVPVEQVWQAASEAVTAVMNDHGRPAGCAPLVWCMDDLRVLDPPPQWPNIPRVAICGAPRFDAAAPADDARQWAELLKLQQSPPRVRGVIEWTGRFNGMTVRVWGWADGHPAADA